MLNTSFRTSAKWISFSVATSYVLLPTSAFRSWHPRTTSLFCNSWSSFCNIKINSLNPRWPKISKLAKQSDNENMKIDHRRRFDSDNQILPARHRKSSEENFHVDKQSRISELTTSGVGSASFVLYESSSFSRSFITWQGKIHFCYPTKTFSENQEHFLSRPTFIDGPLCERNPENQSNNPRWIVYLSVILLHIFSSFLSLRRKMNFLLKRSALFQQTLSILSQE